ncbi:MAG: hypothetical protein CMI02_05515 [Oceanospirillaceae bacterium]|nr:hypothetical protein [Oceanospirillaceae bacterium]MBT11477.1 hypothetical protein [Oceanospirillaceae bacterium]|tara:strand:- start:12050 stop:12346 length:297 start_codon:yes stop_codon:yes gene_type:complete
MTDLLAELEQTLAQLEIIRDSVAVPDAQLIRQISDLYDQQQRLLESEISAQTSQYQQAAQAMKEAAAKARSEAEAISDVAGLINTVASALEAVEGLLG